ncbi:MAG: tetratricopeptide repeat protein [Proteobacteria bacterium]|nr:tetratricopeptide repeat protein [Pseudomonadota bacterium]
MHNQAQTIGEQHLALGALYARAGDPTRAYAQLRAAGRLKVARGRLQLVLALLYRRIGRYDAALGALTQVLVEHPDQPYALVQLWKTIFEAQLRAAPLKTPLRPVLDRLSAAGMHLPAQLSPSPTAARDSAKLSASGYQQLLAGRLGQAVQLFEGAIEALPSNARAHRGLGIARAREEDLARAAGAYQLYLELAPDAADANRVDWVLMQYWRDRPGAR